MQTDATFYVEKDRIHTIREWPGRTRYAVSGLQGNRDLAAFIEREIVGREPKWLIVADSRSGRVLIELNSFSLPNNWGNNAFHQLQAALVRYAGRRQNPAKNQIETREGTGLTTSEAQRRLMEVGENRIPEIQGPGWKAILLEQSTDGMSLLLFAVALGSFALKRKVDAFAIMSVLCINIGVALWQEYRIQKESGGFRNLEATAAHVFRDGIQHVIPASQLVPGDVVFIEAGDAVPADGQIVEGTKLLIDESMITGEAMPISKNAGLVFLGTSITRGKAKIVITGTGENAYLGQIAKDLLKVKPDKSPLQIKMQLMFRNFSIGLAFWTGLTSMIALIRGNPLHNVFMTNLTLYISAVPEGLPLLLLVAQVYTARKVHNSVLRVRRLSALEALASTTVFCTDKTGTLTRNEMTVAKVYGKKPFSGPREFVVENTPGLTECSILCNDASLEHAGWQGDPLEIALLRHEQANGMNIKLIRNQFTRRFEEPFDAEQRRMSVVCESGNGALWLMVKGAPETVLSYCDHDDQIAHIPWYREEREKVLKELEEQAEENAIKVIAFAIKQLPDDVRAPDFDSLLTEMCYLGSIGLFDPPRNESFASIQQMKKSGVRIAMLTGDHPATAVAVGRAVGILKDPLRQVLTGVEVDRFTDEELQTAVHHTSIYARLTPIQKLRVVQALKARGEIVAMAGDGVNDALAIRHANVGIAMGKGGCEVAKHSSSLWLMEDDLGNFVKGLHVGRQMLGSIERAVGYLLGGNLSEVMFFSAGIWLGWPVAFGPTQILLINLLTDSLPTFVMMTKSNTGMPLEQSDKLFGKVFWKQVAVRAGVMGTISLGLYRLGLSVYKNEQTARTLALVSVISNQLVNLEGWRVSPQRDALISKDRWILGSMLSTFFMLGAVIYIPLLRRIFSVAPIPVSGILLAGAGAIGSGAISRTILAKEDSHGRRPSQSTKRGQDDSVSRARYQF